MARRHDPLSPQPKSFLPSPLGRRHCRRVIDTEKPAPSSAAMTLGPHAQITEPAITDPAIPDSDSISESAIS
jgi:hypothetical protein